MKLREFLWLGVGVCIASGNVRAESPTPSPMPSPSASMAPLDPMPVYTQRNPNWINSNRWVTESQILYVSSSQGKDTNPGTQALPIQTLARAQVLEKTLKYPWIMLKRGDTFRSPGGFYLHSKAVDAAHPIVLTSYGDGSKPLPVVEMRGLSFGSSHVHIKHLHFVRDPSLPPEANVDGIYGSGGIQDVLIEDNQIEGFFTNILFDYGGGKFDHQIQIRRNVISDATSRDPKGGGFSQGIYIHGVKGLLVEDNVFDHNGYNYPQDPKGGGTIGNIFDHQCYINVDNWDVTVRGNLFLRGLDSCQLRTGGYFEDNFNLQNAIAIFFGYSRGWVSRNVILEGNDISPTLPRGFGISGGKKYADSDTFLVQDNLVAHPLSPTLGQGIEMGKVALGVVNRNIVYGLGSGLVNSGANPGLQIQYNQVVSLSATPLLGVLNALGGVWSYNQYFGPTQTRVFFSQGKRIDYGAFEAATSEMGGVWAQPNFVDPNRTVETYLASLGIQPATREHFYALVRKQDRQHYDVRLTAYRLNAYFQAGFQVKP